MKTPWLPASSTIPQGFATDRLCVRPLTIHDAVKGYDAVMSSRNEFWELFGRIALPGRNPDRDNLGSRGR